MSADTRGGRGKSEKSLHRIAVSYDILGEIHPAGVRDVCYQLFTRKLIPSMAKTGSNRASRLLKNERDAGDISWSWIVDETREPERVPVWSDPAAYFKVILRVDRPDRWTDQPVRIEVWSEKGTVRGTLAAVLDEGGWT